MELDVDQVKGLNYVEKIREKIERNTKRKCIPVWHVPRSIQYFKDLCEKYDYITIGGIGNTDVDEIHPKDFPKLKTLVDYVHKHNTKVHGLGFTPMKFISKIHFDSVDSSSWTSGSRYVILFKFNPKTGKIETLQKRSDKRYKNRDTIDYHNYIQWKEFQKHALIYY